VTTRTFCSAGDCITVTESTQHPNVIHISTRHDGQPGRAQLTVTKGEYEAFVAGIKAEERERIRQLAVERQARYRTCLGTHPNSGDCKAWHHRAPFADLIGEPS
jgi:hypothetical protein